MKVCLHTYYEISNPYIGGTQTLLIKLAKELIVLGHEAFIVCSSLNPHFVVEGVNIYGVIPNQFVHLLQTKYEGVASSKFLKEAIFANNNMEDSLLQLANYSYEQFSRFQADVYHVNSYVAAFPDNATLPIVAYQHENEEEFNDLWGADAFLNLIRWIKTRTRDKATKPRLFTASHYYAKQFSGLLGLPVQGMHLGILLNDIVYSRAVSTTEDTTFSRTDSSIVILVPSRFSVKQKGQDLAIEACNLLRDKGYDIELVFSGAKKSLMADLDSFRETYKKMEIASHAHFISAKDMLRLYESVHIVLSPERYCSYGLSISESLAAGIPTILSDIPTYLEIASGYDHAFFFENNNLESLFLRLEAVIKNAETYNFRYNESAIDFRINNDIRKTAIEFSHIYKQLLPQ